MARIQLVVPDEDRDRYVHQARKEGMSLSAWLGVAARRHYERQQRGGSFRIREDLERFFSECDALGGPEQEPGWEKHLEVINRSRLGSASRT